MTAGNEGDRRVNTGPTQKDLQRAMEQRRSALSRHLAKLKESRSTQKNP